MKDIFIGLVIIFVAFILIDFIYTEKNSCIIETCSSCTKEEVKCGIIKKQFSFDINLFGRYW